MSGGGEYGLTQIEALSQKLETANFNYEKEVADAIVGYPSMLDVYDYLFAIMFGAAGAALTTNEQITAFLNQIHEVSNNDKPSSPNALIEFLAKLLRHHGDWIDTVDGKGKFVNRAAKKIEGEWVGAMNAPHRIFWGHDIFSISADNPIWLSIQQYGPVRGILQAVRHLIADTCSKQGLPLPFHSWFDYMAVEKGDGQVGNRMLDFCQQYRKDVLGRGQGGGNNDVFNHLFSIHMQDALSSGLVAAGVKAYQTARGISNEDRLIQIRIIAYAVNFYGSAVIGAVQTGIPFINYPCFAALAKNTAQLIRVSNQDIQRLLCEMERIALADSVLEQREQAVHKELVESLYGQISGPVNRDRDQLIDFLRKE